MTAGRQKIRIAEHIEVFWTSDTSDVSRCPNCLTVNSASRLIEIDYCPPPERYRFIVSGCPHCGAKYFDNGETMDYGTDELIEIGWHAYQTQVGAGLWSIAQPLTQIEKPAGARVLEIGGAYGFGLDFAIRARNWTGEGYDPSPLAKLGAEELGLALQRGFFSEKDLARSPYDVIVATEVIEHIADPPSFLELMFRALADDGVLMVTTPDGEKITPGLPAADLLPMLSPGAHLVLQSSKSLEIALRNAGFAHVEIWQNGLSLVGFASAAGFELTKDPARSRAIYRRYLLERSQVSAPNSDLLFGFSGRALFEAVNDQDFSAADQAWKVLLPATLARFGIDLDTITELPAYAMQASLAELIILMPLGLGLMLYSRAIYLLLQGKSRRDLLPLLRLALAALNALQMALARRSLTDGLSAELQRAARSEIALCLAEIGDTACIPALTALHRHDANRGITAWRAFVSLVNNANFAQARELKQTAGLLTPDMLLMSNLRQDALFTTGILMLQDPADWRSAADVFAQLRHLLLQSMPDRGATNHLFWPALRGEVVALHHLDRGSEATELLREFIPLYDAPPSDLIEQINQL